MSSPQRQHTADLPPIAGTAPQKIATVQKAEDKSTAQQQPSSQVPSTSTQNMNGTHDNSTSSTTSSSRHQQQQLASVEELEQQQQVIPTPYSAPPLLTVETPTTSGGSVESSGLDALSPIGAGNDPLHDTDPSSQQLHQSQPPGRSQRQVVIRSPTVPPGQGGENGGAPLRQTSSGRLIPDVVGFSSNNSSSGSGSDNDNVKKAGRTMSGDGSGIPSALRRKISNSSDSPSPFGASVESHFIREATTDSGGGAVHLDERLSRIEHVLMTQQQMILNMLQQQQRGSLTNSTTSGSQQVSAESQQPANNLIGVGSGEDEALVPPTTNSGDIFTAPPPEGVGVVKLTRSPDSTVSNIPPNRSSTTITPSSAQSAKIPSFRRQANSLLPSGGSTVAQQTTSMGRNRSYRRRRSQNMSNVQREQAAERAAAAANAASEDAKGGSNNTNDPSYGEVLPSPTKQNEKVKSFSDVKDQQRTTEEGNKKLNTSAKSTASGAEDDGNKPLISVGAGRHSCINQVTSDSSIVEMDAEDDDAQQMNASIRSQIGSQQHNADLAAALGRGRYSKTNNKRKLPPPPPKSPLTLGIGDEEDHMRAFSISSNPHQQHQHQQHPHFDGNHNDNDHHEGGGSGKHGKGVLVSPRAAQMRSPRVSASPGAVAGGSGTGQGSLALNKTLQQRRSIVANADETLDSGNATPRSGDGDPNNLSSSGSLSFSHKNSLHGSARPSIDNSQSGTFSSALKRSHEDRHHNRSDYNPDESINNRPTVVFGDLPTFNSNQNRVGEDDEEQETSGADNREVSMMSMSRQRRRRTRKIKEEDIDQAIEHIESHKATTFNLEDPLVIMMDVLYISLCSVAAIAVNVVMFQTWGNSPDVGPIVCFALVEVFGLFWLALRFRVRSRKDEWQVVDQHADIKSTYLRTWFLFDLLLALPLELLFVSWLNVAFRAFAARHYLRWIRIFSLNSSTNPLVHARHYFRLINFTSMAVWLAHLLALLFMLIENEKGQDHSLNDSLYFIVATITSTGYGDIQPLHTSRTFINCSMIFGSFLVATMTALATDLVTTKDVHAAEMDKKKKMMYAMLKHYEIPWDVQNEVISVFPAVLGSQSEEQFRILINTMPQTVADKIESYLRVKLLKSLPMFKNLNDMRVIYALSDKLKRRFHDAFEVIIETGEPGFAMYFVISGMLEVTKLIEETDEDIVVATLHAGSFFGEMALVNDAPRAATVATILPTELLHLAKTDFLVIKKKYTVLQDRINEEARKREKDLREKEQDRSMSVRPTSAGNAPRRVNSSIIPRSNLAAHRRHEEDIMGDDERRRRSRNKSSEHDDDFTNSIFSPDESVEGEFRKGSGLQRGESGVINPLQRGAGSRHGGHGMMMD